MVDYFNTTFNLRLNIDWIKDNIHHQFPGWGNSVAAMEDALELIEQQHMQIEHMKGSAIQFGRCKECGAYINNYDNKIMCGTCGAKINWDEQ